MTSESKITEKEMKVLLSIWKGHPSRNMRAQANNQSYEVNAITTEELEVCTGESISTLGNSLAILGQYGLIDSGREKHGVWSALRGKQPKFYWWITGKGIRYCLSSNEASDAQLSDENGIHASIDRDLRDDAKQVLSILKSLGFSPTRAGIFFASELGVNMESPFETALNIALATIAQDLDEFSRDGEDFEKLVSLSSHAAAIAEEVGIAHKGGHLSLERASVLSAFFRKLIQPGEERNRFTQKIMSATVKKTGRLANSNILKR